MSPTAAASHPSTLARVDSVFDDWQAPDRPGGWVVVLHKGEALFKRAYGTPSVEHGLQWREETRFRIFGVTMAFTALATLLLADRGVLSIESDVRQYLPELPEYGPTIRIRHLLTHTSGLRDSETIAFAAGFVHTSPCSMEYALELMRRQKHLNFEPGTEVACSNSNFRLLALVLERVLDKPFEALMQELIFKPLGMHDSLVVPVDGRIIPHLATGYTLNPDGSFVNIPVAVASTGDRGIVSSMRDMTRWVQALREGLLGSGDLLARIAQTAVLPDGTHTGAGMGVRVGSQFGARFLGMGGEHYGYGCEYLHFPEDDLAIVICANYYDARLEARAHAVAAAWIESLRGSHSSPGPAALAPEIQHADLTGLYASASTPLVVKVSQPGQQEFGAELFISAGLGGFVQVEPGSFVSGAGYSSIRARFTERPGRRPLLRILTRGREMELDPVAPEYLSAERMHEYTGLYGCAELNSVHRVYIQNGRLLHLRGLGEWPAEQVRELVMVSQDLFALDYPDKLADLFTTVKFTRSRTGRVTRLTLANRDISGIEMERLPDSLGVVTNAGAHVPGLGSADPVASD
jgi:CubicO group peptidase (beta-lactamase class C family)